MLCRLVPMSRAAGVGLEQQKGKRVLTPLSPSVVQTGEEKLWLGSRLLDPGCWSLGFHHELFQRLLPLIPTKQKNFFDFVLLETHIVELR